MFVLIWIFCKLAGHTLFGSHVLMALTLYIAFILSDISDELGYAIEADLIALKDMVSHISTLPSADTKSEEPKIELSEVFKYLNGFNK